MDDAQDEGGSLHFLESVRDCSWIRNEFPPESLGEVCDRDPKSSRYSLFIFSLPSKVCFSDLITDNIEELHVYSSVFWLNSTISLSYDFLFFLLRLYLELFVESTKEIKNWLIIEENNKRRERFHYQARLLRTFVSTPSIERAFTFDHSSHTLNSTRQIRDAYRTKYLVDRRSDTSQWDWRAGTRRQCHRARLF